VKKIIEIGPHLPQLS